MDRSSELVLLAKSAISMSGKDIDGPVALGVSGGVLTGVVRRSDAATLIGPNTAVLDYGNRVLLPGFVDPHSHFETAAKVGYTTVDCSWPRCESISDVLDVLRDNLGNARDGWVVGIGNLFFDRKLKDGRFPTKDELDSVSRDVALAVRCGGHISVLNSKAFELAGINDHYQGVGHSTSGRATVERDADGRLTGTAKEMDSLIPYPKLDPSELDDAIEIGLRNRFTRYGVTTLGEITESHDGLMAMDRGHFNNKLGTRIAAYLWVPGTLTLDEACDHRSWLQTRSAADRMGVGGVKIFADGGYTAANAALTRPYAIHPHNCGEMAMSSDEIISVLRRTANAGLQLAIHANGDRAQLEVCAAIASVRDELPASAPQTRIEHAGNFLPDYDRQVRAYAEAGIRPVPQPRMLQNIGEFIPEYVGDYAWDTQFPFRRMLDDGWDLCASSDIWLESEGQEQSSPFFAIDCCVNRRMFHGGTLSPDQAITIDEALRMHTMGSAAAMGIADTRGSLEPGKLADVIVLDKDPRVIPSEKILDLQVDEVFLAGESRFRRDGAEPSRRLRTDQLS